MSLLNSRCLLMISYCFRLLIVFTLYRCVFSAPIIEHTIDRDESYRDCFISSNVDKEINDWLFYCRRIDDLSVEALSNSCYTGKQVTFDELQMARVTAHELLQWHIPLDMADLYGSFLSHTSYDDHRHFICNCSTVNTFGRYCEYSFEKGIDTVEELLNSTMKEKKEFYPEDRLLTCYNLENNTERCLDYRDICDGEFDTIHGDDELYCDRIETNVCSKDEFRCRNGLCIDRRFLFDGQADCTDLTDEQSLLMIKKYNNFEHCYERASFDCDEHWCGREMVSCGDGQCIPWFQRFWNGFDCSNFYTHVHNCELEERLDKSIDFSISDNDGRCTMNITEFNVDNDPCLLMIKCAITLHPSCKSINMLFSETEEAIRHVHNLCQNRTFINYASEATFLSPFVRAYYIPSQFEKYKPDFLWRMKARQPGLFCLIGKRMCQGIEVTHNGSKCFVYDDIYEKNYPFPPYESLFCQSANLSINDCVNGTFFYRCQTSGGCISKYRLFDGFPDCLDSSDENDLDALHSLSPLFMKDRYNCTIDGNSSNAVLRHFLGDGTSQCLNGTDEMSLSINWQQQQCLKSDDFACSLLRDLNNTNNEKQSTHILRFTSLCDSIWDLRNGSDEIDCGEWICEPGWIKQQGNNLSRWSGNCINTEWQCNGIWDYTDGSDEYDCNRTESYPIPDCLLLGTDEIIALNQSNTRAGNGIVECSGGVDERVTFSCNDGFPLNERFLCDDKITCLKPMHVCNYFTDCPSGEDESEFWCGLRPSLNESICGPKRFACLERNDSGPCIPHENRCQEKDLPCTESHREMHMCIRPRKYNHIVSKTSPSLEMQHAETNVISPWYCDRGLLVRRYAKLVCLCPPSYFGHRCEKHSHRLTVIFTLNIDIVKADLIRIIVLLIHHNVTIDHVLIPHEPSYTGKHRLYLNYPRNLYANLRQIPTNYIVQIRVYTVGYNSVKLLFVSQYPVKYSFLPAFRIAVVLRDKDNLLLKHQSDRNDFYDFVRDGLEKQEQQNPSICSCALNSTCLLLGNQRTTCICASQQYGPTCHLIAAPCRLNFCQNQGTCISYTNKFHDSEFRCSCSTDHFGKHCEYKKAVLSIDLHNETGALSAIRIIQLINYDIMKMHLKLERQHLLLEESERIFYDDLQLPSIALMKVYDPVDLNIYLLYFRHNYSAIDITEQNKTKCRHAKEFNLISTDYSHQALLFIMKRYHRPCHQLNQKNTVCFYDPQTYFCFCNATTQRSLCFFYDFKSDRCNECLNGGSCYAGEQASNKKNFICRCTPCLYGALCEFRMDHWKYTFESLLILDLSSTNNKLNQTIRFQPKYTIWIYMTISAIMVTVGFFSNIITYQVLAQQGNIQSIIPRYIQLTAIANQLTLVCLLIQIVSIILNQYSMLNQSFLSLFCCKSSSYLLNCFAYTSKWYTAILSISRLRLTSQMNLTRMYSRKQFIWPLIIILTIFLFNVTEVIFHRLINDPRQPKHFICNIEFSESGWYILETVFRFIMHLIPFLLNMYAVITIIRTVARSKANIKKTNFISELWNQIKQYYEQLACPMLMILCSTPELLMALIVKCHQWDNVYRRSLMIAMHLLSFLPQMLTYNLFIQPSKTYKNTFVPNTRIGQLLSTIIRTS